jgi:hypothetical protein
LGAKVWTCKPPPVELVPEDDDPEAGDVGRLGVPSVMLRAPEVVGDAAMIFPACLCSCRGCFFGSWTSI